MDDVGPYSIVCLYENLTYAWVQIFIKVFYCSIERVLYCDMEESWLLRQIRRHVRKARLGAQLARNWWSLVEDSRSAVRLVLRSSLLTRASHTLVHFTSRLSISEKVRRLMWMGTCFRNFRFLEVVSLASSTGMATSSNLSPSCRMNSCSSALKAVRSSK